jgi:metallophosphoesterase (TIGR00282 family)
VPVNVLFIGDIVGKPGRSAVSAHLRRLVEDKGIDLVIANCENAAGGFGITERVASDLFRLGVRIMTSGNHVWDKKEAVPYLAKEERILRPINYPPGVPGFGSIVHRVRDGLEVAVLNASGRVFMPNIDCPFRATEREVTKLRERTRLIVVDFHAEATSEKIAFGYFLDGRVSAVVGTHTHVQTADEKILAGGTAYITDVGMTGPVESVIGVEKEQIIERFLTAMPSRFEVAKGLAVFSAVAVGIEEETGLASSIERFQLEAP